MRRLLMVALLLVGAGFQVGCAMPMYSSSPQRRAKQMIYQSESLRHVPNIWERIWMIDTPDFATPYRTHGGVI